jgi:hypothetical protein
LSGFAEPFRKSLEFGGFVLAHCAAIIEVMQPGELICPFVVLQKGKNRQTVEFESDSQHESVRRGWASLEQYKGLVDLWAFGREGLYGLKDSAERTDVLVVSVWSVATDSTVSLTQRFSPKHTGAFSLFGPVEIVVDETELSAPERDPLQSVVMKGVSQHPKGARWNEWRAAVTPNNRWRGP